MLRHREKRGPLSLSHYPVTLLCFHWHGRRPHRSVLRGLHNATVESNPSRTSDDREGDMERKKYERLGSGDMEQMLVDEEMLAI